MKYLGRVKVEWVKPAHISVDLRALVEQVLKLRVSFSAGNAKTSWADYLSRSFNGPKNVFFPFVAARRKKTFFDNRLLCLQLSVSISRDIQANVTA